MGMHVHLKNTRDGDPRRHPRRPASILQDGVVARRAIWSSSPRASDRMSSSRSAPGWRSIAASSSATTWRAVRRRTSTPSASAPSTAGASTGWWRRCGNRCSVLADRLTGRKPGRLVPGIDHLDEVEGGRRRSRRDGRQGAGRRRRRGGQLCGAVARRLQEADRPRQPPGRRHRHGRRRDRARSDPGVSRVHGRWRTAGLELLFPTVERDQQPPAPDRIPDTAQICDCNAVTRRQIVEAVLGGARTLQAVSDLTRACTGCGSCRPQVQAIVEFACQGAPLVEVMAAGAGRRAAGGDADRRRRRRHPQQDRALQEGKGRPRHPRRCAADRAVGMGGDRRGRPRAAEVGGRVLPPSDAGPFHDAPADVRTASATPRRCARSRRSAGSSAPGSPTSRRGSSCSCAGSGSSSVPEIWDRLDAVGPGVAPDRHGQHPQRRRLPRRRPDAARAVRRLADRARVHRHASCATRRSPTCRGSSTSASPGAPNTARMPSRRTCRSYPRPRASTAATSAASTCWSAARSDRADSRPPDRSTCSCARRRRSPSVRRSRSSSAITDRGRRATAPGWRF